MRLTAWSRTADSQARAGPRAAADAVHFVEQGAKDPRLCATRGPALTGILPREPAVRDRVVNLVEEEERWRRP